MNELPSSSHAGIDIGLMKRRRAEIDRARPDGDQRLGLVGVVAATADLQPNICEIGGHGVVRGSSRVYGTALGAPMLTHLSRSSSAAQETRARSRSAFSTTTTSIRSEVPARRAGRRPSLTSRRSQVAGTPRTRAAGSSRMSRCRRGMLRTRTRRFRLWVVSGWFAGRVRSSAAATFFV